MVNLRQSSILTRLGVIQGDGHAWGNGKNGDAGPLRAELFGISQLRSHARRLAEIHEVETGYGPEVLLHRLGKNQEMIRQSHMVVAGAVEQGRPIAPAAEWLLDNFYLIEEQIQIARDHLPRGYSRELPRLSSGTMAGLPRVYAISHELVSHTDGRLDMENLSAFVEAYQENATLMIGELWAVPIMLRLTLIENVRRVTQHIAFRRRERDRAITWAERFLTAAKSDRNAVITELAAFVKQEEGFSMPFLTELVSSLHGQHPSLGLVLTWLEQQLAEQGQSIEQVQQAESQSQAAEQVSIGHSIQSLRLMNSSDWREFVEKHSKIEQVLRGDPAGVYGQMDFSTRDRYRHVVERLARWSGKTETDVAGHAVRLAELEPASDLRRSHVGFFLLEGGRPALREAIEYPEGVGAGLIRFGRRHRLGSYLGLASLLTLAVVVPATIYAQRLWDAPHREWFCLAVALTTACVAWRSGLQVVNWLIALCLRPRSLPRLDYSKGIPADHITAVAVPTLLTSLDSGQILADGLELRYLANRGEHLLFVLLTDLADAPHQVMPEDGAIIAAATKAVDDLNARYANEERSLFYLLHRPRLWNSAEGVWMGHERKRGKLSDFNRLILEGRTEPFAQIIGNVSRLREVKHVITLDTDTQLPPETAWKMIGTMAHPLNRPVVDPGTRCVRVGYGVLQPRVAINLTSAGRSLFSRLFAGEVGIDPYTREVSNSYHDLFGRNPFIGKGIYDVEAFELCLGTRFPENTILSHDLIEGCHVSCGFLNDVEVIEEHPSRYLADMARRHRWVRGDWQIAGWVAGTVRTLTGRGHNPLDRFSRWLILDNLRRSTLPPVAVLGLLLGMLLPWPGPAVWLSGFLLTWFAPDILRAAVSATRRGKGTRWVRHLLSVARAEGRGILISGLDILFMPYQAVVYLDAIGRALWRMGVSHRRLLQWQTADEADASANTSIWHVGAAMAGAEIAAMLLLVTVVVINPSVWPLTIAVGAIWLVAPLAAWFVSRDRIEKPVPLSQESWMFLRRLARRTWAYYEHFINAEQSWLPPDNVQEIPTVKVAERTSPTNIGLGLLGTLSAWDFGYISGQRLVQRLHNSFAAMEKLDRYRGHFFNWYATRDGRALHPRYVSSVDSGNLVGCLLALGQGLGEVLDRAVLPARWREGLLDTLGLAQEEMERESPPQGNQTDRQRLVAELNELKAQITKASPTRLAEAAAILQSVEQSAERLRATEGIGQEPAYWLEKVAQQAMDLRQDLLWLIPSLAEDTTTPVTVTLRELARMSAAAGSTDTQTCQIRATERIGHLRELSTLCDSMSDIDLDFLFDTERRLLAIGYDFENHRRDPNQYDLLASEARLASYIGVARGQLPQEHWFHLSRVPAGGRGPTTLVSWSGSMFEYLMPMLLMPSYRGTLLHEAGAAAVMRQRRYGLKYLPYWGVSESGFNQLDAHMNYQYRAFGVPGLGLKRGLGDDLVLAPYASAMAVMVEPVEATANLQAMVKEGFVGRYGLYEAVDFTADRVPKGQTYAIVRQFMAHHTGMALLSMERVLLGEPMQRRFLADPEMRAAILLLQERVPTIEGEERPITHQSVPAAAEGGEQLVVASRTLAPEEATVPEVHLLSNGRYSCFVTSAGAGQSRWGNLALTRWREDLTRDAWGLFFYVHDVDRHETWSTTYQPMPAKKARYRVVFSQGQAEFRCRYSDLDIVGFVAVSPEDDVEIRRMTLTNTSGRTRTIELTGYAEVALAEPRAEAAHPAFSNLFLETQLLSERTAVLCNRRPRSSEDPSPWMFFAMVGSGIQGSHISYETDRSRFLGRGRGPAEPAAMLVPGPLSNTVGAVLDPVLAIRLRLRLRPGETVELHAVLGAAEHRERIVQLVDRYHDPRMADRVLETAWTHSQVLLHQIGSEEQDAVMYAQLAGAILYLSPRYRADASILARNTKPQSDLWRYGISGDLPIVLCRITERSGLDLARSAIRAQAYWRHKGLVADLVIWAEAFAGYRQTLMDEIIGVVAAMGEARWLDQPAGIFVRSLEQIPEDDRLLFQAAARVILHDRSGSFSEQIRRRTRREVRVNIPALRPSRTPEPPAPDEMLLPDRELMLFNGLGGFTPDGREYVIQLRPGQTTPAPWSNLIANPNFGTVVTESGGGYTWCANAHEFRLTPWYNDPVSDTTTEAVYVQDVETTTFWSCSPRPAPGPTPYVCRHGLGYTAFEHTQNGLFTELIQAVPPEAPLKISYLRIRNVSDRQRSVRVVGYCRWALGEQVERTQPHIVTRIDPQTGAIFATNRFSVDFGDRVAFFAGSGGETNVTGDRTEFLGRHGSGANPAAMGRQQLSNRVGPGLDPCGAVEVRFSIPPGETRYAVIVLGAASSEGEARHLVRQFGGDEGAREALESVWQYWKHLLGAVWLETPDPSVNFLSNNWLLYQVLASRFWGRSGFYQSGGAFGFRDQLQDSMAFMLECPWLARPHILMVASRQFRKGDVQHWWHPPTGRGVRTHFSDDFLWLPQAVCRYIKWTGDTGILDEQIPFIEGRALSPEEESYYDLPQITDEKATLYEHCVRAIDHGWRLGAHGLPLMGVGDWNDGMNRVGHGGKGESVWLAFFLYDVLKEFGGVAGSRGDAAYAELSTRRAEELRQNIELGAWDGRWYRRAYFDDGRALGSSENEECRIDAIPQAWAVLSGAADPNRARQAMNSAVAELVDYQNCLIRLFTPPFNRAEPNPGYIRGYVPGVRENGGQYTHAAVWMVMAAAKMHDTQLTWRLFDLINPLRHTDSPEKVERYRVEPYVVAADVYTLAGQEGRGGWTWYTGSAAWMYRLLNEELLGLRVEVDVLTLHPLLPPEWKGFRFHYRFRSTFYHVQVQVVGQETWNVRKVMVDGTSREELKLHMVDDHVEHQVVIDVG